MRYRYSIGIDMHQRYSFMSVKDTFTGEKTRTQVVHTEPALSEFFADYQGQAAAAVEATRNWYWMVNLLERWKIEPHLADPTATKPLIGRRQKTDRIDADGLSNLLAEDLLPESWIAPEEVRDYRELLRNRMALVAVRTGLKNRLHALVERYLPTPVVADLFGKTGRTWMGQLHLPSHAEFALQRGLGLLDQVEVHVAAYEAKIKQTVPQTPEAWLLDTLPGVAALLASVIASEVGDVRRFPSHEHLCSYSGLTPVIQSSGGTTRFNPTSKASNRYLRWAFIEAANVVAAHPSPRPCYQRFVRLKERCGYPKATVALARHLAVAAYHMLRKKETYQEKLVPAQRIPVVLKERRSRRQHAPSRASA